MKYTYIKYIISEFTKQYPLSSTEKLESRLLKASEDDVYRVANTIERFGIEILENLVRNNV